MSVNPSDMRKSPILTEDLMGEFRRAAIRLGWSDVPICPYVYFTEDGRLRCDYNYAKFLNKHRLLQWSLFVGRPITATEQLKEKLRTECSPATCPLRKQEEVILQGKSHPQLRVAQVVETRP